jgi:hypothetical protein
LVIEKIKTTLPMLVEVMSEAWLRRNNCWIKTFIMPRLPWFEQLENDLVILDEHVGLNSLISCYRNSLRNQSQIQKTIFEIHGAAFMATAATDINLHVPRGDGSGRNFDFLVKIEGHSIHVESKTRKDEFPFNLPAEPDDLTGIKIYGGVRETLDRHDAENFGLELTPHTPTLPYQATPESTVIRQCLLEGLGQLPELGCNVIIFGHIEGDRYDLEEALWGTTVVDSFRNLRTKKSNFVSRRRPTGAFSSGAAGEPFKSLSGVLWIRLYRQDNSLGHAYKLYQNPNAILQIPNTVIEIIDTSIHRYKQEEVM